MYDCSLSLLSSNYYFLDICPIILQNEIFGQFLIEKNVSMLVTYADL